MHGSKEEEPERAAGAKSSGFEEFVAIQSDIAAKKEDKARCVERTEDAARDLTPRATGARWRATGRERRIRRWSRSSVGQVLDQRV
jgi:hypothetical protein